MTERDAALEKCDRHVCQTARPLKFTKQLKSRYRTYSTLKPGYGTVLLSICR